jgi:hypothetical protein
MKPDAAKIRNPMTLADVDMDNAADRVIAKW